MIKKLLKSIVYQNPLRVFLKKLRHQKNQENELRKWEKAGKSASPPHLAKQKIILEYSQKYELKQLIETGTYFGDMVEAMKKEFDRIYSIELSMELFEKARDRFRNEKNVEIVQGDSAIVLANLVPKLQQPTLFWLDGHYFGGLTAKGDTNTPIMDEIIHIMKASDFHHIILIDDARAFGVNPDYPDLEQLEAFVRSKRVKIKLQVKHDVIRIT